MIRSFVLGGGRSGLAIAKSLASLQVLHPELGLQPAQILKRGTPLKQVAAADAALFICNPHGLHANAIIEADQAGFGAIACEKPSCVSLAEAEKLQSVKTKTAIFHVYRQTWGAQMLKQLIDSKELGEIITVEGRYWQSSTAERALQTVTAEDKKKAWKNDPALSGPSDTLIDVGVHWIDFARYLLGGDVSKMNLWKSYVNAETSHRDSHVQVLFETSHGGRAMGSISKNFHGATNHFEINVVGSKGSATWTFLNPDEIYLGSGRDRKVVTRKAAELGSQQPAFHGMGWLEGYMEISLRLLQDAFSGKSTSYPTLAESVALMRAIFQSAPLV